MVGRKKACDSCHRRKVCIQTVTLASRPTAIAMLLVASCMLAYTMENLRRKTKQQNRSNATGHYRNVIGASSEVSRVRLIERRASGESLPGQHKRRRVGTW